MRYIALFLAVLVAGCVGGSGDYLLSGHFTGDATQEDIDLLSAMARTYEAEARIAESFPAQFFIHGLTESECNDLLAKAQDLDFVNYASCSKVDTSGDPTRTASYP